MLGRFYPFHIYLERTHAGRGRSGPREVSVHRASDLRGGLPGHACCGGAGSFDGGFGEAAVKGLKCDRSRKGSGVFHDRRYFSVFPRSFGVAQELV